MHPISLGCACLFRRTMSAPAAATVAASDDSAPQPRPSGVLSVVRPGVSSSSMVESIPSVVSSSRRRRSSSSRVLSCAEFNRGVQDGKIDVASLICGLSEEDRWKALTEWWLGGVLPGALAELSTESCERLCDLFKIMKTSKAAMRKAIAAMIERKLESDDERPADVPVRGDEAVPRLAARRGRSHERIASRVQEAPARRRRPGSRSASEEPAKPDASRRQSPRLVQSAMELAMKLPDVGPAGRRMGRGKSARAEQRSLGAGITRRRREDSAVASSSSSASSSVCSSDSSWSSEDDDADWMPPPLPSRQRSKPHRHSRFSADSIAIASRSSISSPLAPEWLDSVLSRFDSVERAYTHLSSGWHPRNRKEAQALARIIDAIRGGRRADALEMAVRRLVGVHAASQPGGSWRIGDVLEGDVEEHSFLPAKVWARAVKHAASMEGTRSKEGYGSNRREKSPAQKKWDQKKGSDKQKPTGASGSHKAKSTGSSHE